MPFASDNVRLSLPSSTQDQRRNPMPKFSLLCIACAVLLSACNLSQPTLPTPNADNIIYITATAPLPTPNADGVIYVTATPDPNAQVVAAQPTQQPVQAAATPVELVQAGPDAPSNGQVPTVATSNLPVSEQLAQADQLLLNGYFERAAQTYQAVMAAPDATPDAQSEAAFKLGQAALREGLFNSAVAALNTFIGYNVGDARGAQAYFLRGDAYLGLSDWQAAITDFNQYLTLREGLIDSYVYERLGDAHLALGDTGNALAAYGLALNASRSLVPSLVLREKVARIYIDINQTANAVAQYDAILDVARNAPYRATIELYAVQALDAGNQTQAAIERAQRILNEYPQTTAAYSALQMLQANDMTVDAWLRGRINYNYGAYSAAIDAFNEFTSSVPAQDVPAELHLLLGRAYREVGNSAAAQVAFQTLIDLYPADPLFGDALLEQGRTRFLAGDIPAAIETYLSIADRYGYLQATAADALWRAGYLYGTNDEPVRSREVFVRLAEAYPDADLTLNGLFLAASAAVRSQQWDVAENLYGRIAALGSGSDQAAAYLWVGRLAQERNDTRTATDAFALAVSSAPDSYFAARAADLQQNRAPFTPPVQLQFAFDALAERQQAEAWLRSTFGITQQGDLHVLPASIESNPRIVRGQELWTVGAYSEALDEFDAVLDDARDANDVLTSYQLAVYLREIGAYLPSIVAAADIIIASGVPTLDAPPYIARMRFPAYYVDVVQERAPSIDPLLMLSLMRHESLFNTNADGGAAEKGLTQVIPSTAQYIADQLDWPDYQHSDLYRPYAGIAFGAFYLDEQLRRFDGNVIAALAGYNAGPGRAIDWLALSGDDPDLFMTAITISSTRSYVQSIYRNYAVYRVLYGA